MSTKNITGIRIKEIRDNLGLTGSEFGKKLNVTKTAVSYWENGARQPDASMINKIADIGNVSSDYLLGRTDNPNYSLLKTNYKGKEIELVINSKSNNYTQEEIQNLVDRLSDMYVDVEKLMNKKD